VLLCPCQWPMASWAKQEARRRRSSAFQVAFHWQQNPGWNSSLHWQVAKRVLKQATASLLPWLRLGSM